MFFFHLKYLYLLLSIGFPRPNFRRTPVFKTLYPRCSTCCCDSKTARILIHTVACHLAAGIPAEEGRGGRAVGGAALMVVLTSQLLRQSEEDV